MNRTLGMAAAVLAAGTILAGAQPASADTTRGCPDGYVCYYSKTGIKGSLKYKTNSNSGHDVSGVKSVFNNGTRQPGLDHAYVSYRYYLPSGRPITGQKCLHYGWNDGREDFPQGVTVTRVTWGGEC